MTSLTLTLFLLGEGGGGGGIHPKPFFQHYSEMRKDFLLKLGNFFHWYKWVTIFTIKLQDRPFHVAMVMAQIKGVQKWHFQENLFFNSDYRNGSSTYQSVTLPNCAKFYPQTTEIQPFKVERSDFNTMTSFSLTSVEILELSLACGIGLSWATFVPNFVVIWHLLHVIHAFSMYIFCIFPQIDRGFRVMTSWSL